MSVDGWKKVKLGEVVDTNKNSYSGSDNWKFINYLDTGNITENKIDSIHYFDTSVDNIPSRAKRKVNVNDIVYSTVRPNQKHYGIIKKPIKNMLVSTGFTVITSKKGKSDSGYLYYYLSQQNIVDLLHTIGEHSTSAYPSIKPRDLEDIDIFLPSLPEQKAIAATLSCLDDKIELNNRINKALEEMAQAIFKSWFVDFEPFQDGEFEDSELGRIPKGWRAGCIEDIAKQVSNVIRRDDIKDGSRYIGLEHIPRKQMILDQFGSIEEVTSNKLQFEKYNVILGKIRPYFHKVSIAPWDGYCSTDAIVLAPKMNDSFSYMFLTAFSDSFVRYAVQISHGTKMPRAEWKALKEYRVVLPPTPVMTSFNQIVLPIIDKMVFDCCENNKLKKTRDTLLPKLMSGEIRVPIEEVQ